MTIRSFRLNRSATGILRGKTDSLFQIEIFYCIVIEGARSKTGIGAAFPHCSAIQPEPSAN